MPTGLHLTCVPFWDSRITAPKDGHVLVLDSVGTFPDMAQGTLQT